MSGLSGFFDYVGNNREYLLTLTREHLVITLIALALGGVLGVALGILAYRLPPLRSAIIGSTGLILTIPSLALYALLVGILGLGAVPVVAALVLYSLLPVVRNTVVGLLAVPPAVIEAAQGQGMGATRRLVRVQLPLAWPVIVAGLRVSAVVIVGIAALGAIVNGPGLGAVIFDGLRRVGSPVAINAAVAGTAAVVALGILLDAAFIVLGRVTTPRGIRG